MRSLGRFPMFVSIYVVALAGLSAVYFAGMELKPEPHAAETKTAPAPAAETKAPPAPSETAGAAKAPEKPDAAVATADVAGGDPKAGSGLFHACQACHSIDPGKNMVGPSLAGVVGRKAGSEAGYNYSEAMKNAGFTWTAEQLSSYLADPKKIVPGNKMPYAGMKSADDRKNLIAFLREHPKPS
jgi:cytochrome c2